SGARGSRAKWRRSSRFSRLTRPAILRARSLAWTADCSERSYLMTTALDNLKAEIKQAIVRSLRLPITPEEIGDSTPLFGEGLGLDSIDVLELVLEIERSFGVTIGDEQTGMKVLGSVETIADFITIERAKRSV